MKIGDRIQTPAGHQGHITGLTRNRGYLLILVQLDHPDYPKPVAYPPALLTRIEGKTNDKHT